MVLELKLGVGSWIELELELEAGGKQVAVPIRPAG